MDLIINSEVNPLRMVITHRPGLEHEYIKPSNIKETIDTSDGKTNNPDFLLFDDIIHVNSAQIEHQSLYDILHYFTDGNCYEFVDLFKTILITMSWKSSFLRFCIKSCSRRIFSLNVDFIE